VRHDPRAIQKKYKAKATGNSRLESEKFPLSVTNPATCNTQFQKQC